MKTLQEVINQKLVWVYLKPLGIGYELRLDNEVFASFRFKDSKESFLYPSFRLVKRNDLKQGTIAESGDGRWTFKGKGIFARRLFVTTTESDDDIAQLRFDWLGRGTLQFTNGHKFKWIWGRFIDERGVCVISFYQKFPVWGWSGDRLVIESSGVVVDELPLLALIGCYILRSSVGACC